MAKLPDVNSLPDSARMVRNEMVGVKDNGYLDKKGTPSGNARLLELPPGTNIQDQSVADIRDLPMKVYSGGTSFPGDGW